MKKPLIAFIGVVSIGVALPALAGPDWQLIEQGRNAKLARMQAAAPPQVQDAGSSTAGQDVQMDRMMKECAEMMKKS